jgi:hypothetical protein
MELFPSVIITDGKILSVIPLVFSGFLVVKKWKDAFVTQGITGIIFGVSLWKIY